MNDKIKNLAEELLRSVAKVLLVMLLTGILGGLLSSYIAAEGGSRFEQTWFADLGHDLVWWTLGFRLFFDSVAQVYQRITQLFE